MKTPTVDQCYLKPDFSEGSVTREDGYEMQQIKLPDCRGFSCHETSDLPAKPNAV